MERTRFISTFKIYLLAGFFSIAACNKHTDRETGILTGTISIGPLCPVETDPPDPGCLPTAETYKAFPVYVWTADYSRRIILISPALDGTFSTELTPGNYLIKLENEQNGPGGSNLPQVVTINSLEQTIINIDIDTGIR